MRGGRDLQRWRHLLRDSNLPGYDNMSRYTDLRADGNLRRYADLRWLRDLPASARVQL